MTQHDDTPYQERSGCDLNGSAAASLRKNTERRGEVDYEVDCPICHGTVLATEYPGGTYRDLLATATTTDPSTDLAADGKAPSVVVPMACGCGRSHRGAPRGITGCGAVWVVPA